MQRRLSKVQNICLVTISDHRYWPGTKVMLRSFLRQNDWFAGEIILLTREPEFIRRKLRKSGIQAATLTPGNLLRERMELLKHNWRIYDNYLDRLLILEIFRLEGQNRILYIDSDIVHVQAMDPQLIQHSDFMAVRDPWYYRGYGRQSKTLERVKLDYSDAKCLTDFFNSGVLSIGEKYLSEGLYKKIIKKVEVTMYKELKDKLLDEPVLNTFFRGEVQFLPLSYNCSVHLLVRKTYEDAVIALHFTGQNKPWRLLAWVRLLWRTRTYISYLIIWLKNLNNNSISKII